MLLHLINLNSFSIKNTFDTIAAYKMKGRPNYGCFETKA